MMMTFSRRMLGLMLIALFISACSGTKTSDSWSNPNYRGKIKNVYIIGLAKDDLNRMIFEETFEKRLSREGVEAISSFKDNLPTNQQVDREDIIQRLRNSNCDSVLLTKLVRQKKKATISGGRGTHTYTPGLNPGGPMLHTMPKDSEYYSWHNYYSYGRLHYVEPGRADFVILTVETVLYDLKTEELIWFAQLETRLEGNIEKMMQIFVDEATKDLKGKGLI